MFGAIIGQDYVLRSRSLSNLINIWSQSSPKDTYRPGISLSVASSTIDHINLTVLNCKTPAILLFFVSDRTIMAKCCQYAICLLCQENIAFTVKDFACVSRKGLAAINDFSVKYNELNPINIIPIHAFDDNAIMCMRDVVKLTLIPGDMIKCANVNI